MGKWKRTQIKSVKRRSFLAILAGASMLLACDLPVILAVIGLGSFAAATNASILSIWFEVVGIITVIAVLIGLVWYVISRRHKSGELYVGKLTRHRSRRIDRD